MSFCKPIGEFIGRLLRGAIDGSILGEIEKAQYKLWCDRKTPFKMRMSFKTLYKLQNTLIDFRMTSIDYLLKESKYHGLLVEPVVDFEDYKIEMWWKKDSEIGKEIFEVKII